MKFLDERITFTVDWGSYSNIPAAGMYTYTLWAEDEYSYAEEHEVFVGNFYFKSTRLTVLDLTDIIRNSNSLLSGIRSDITNPYAINDVVGDDIVLSYWVTINFNGTTKESGHIMVAHVYRYPNGSEYVSTLDGNSLFFSPSVMTNTIRPLLLGWKPNLTNKNAYDLIPRYPLKNTEHFAYASTFLFGNSVQQINIDITDDSGVCDLSYTITLTQAAIHTLTYVAALAEVLEDYFYYKDEEGYSGNVYFTVHTTTYPTIARFDECYERFYLQWRDRFGSWQCQPLYEVATYSEDIDTKEYLTYTDKRTVYNKQVQPKWKLNTGWIADRYVPYYESIFVSPLLVLYDTKKDKSYEVILNDKYTEKSYRNQKGMVNFELQLEGVESQNIIY